MLDNRNKSDQSNNLVSENKSNLPNDNLNQDISELDDEFHFKN